LNTRRRKLRFGAAVAVVLVGVACGAAIPGTTGGTLATAFVGLGLLGVVSLIFYEVGLSEDRDRARERDRRQRTSERPPGTPTEDSVPGRRTPRRPDRMRGQRRRLR
jgi:hypothetical protein